MAGAGAAVGGLFVGMFLHMFMSLDDQRDVLHIRLLPFPH